MQIQIYKTYKFRIYPTKTQALKLEKKLISTNSPKQPLKSVNHPQITKLTFKTNLQNLTITPNQKTITIPDIGQLKIKGYSNKAQIPFPIATTIKKEAAKYYALLLVKENITKQPFIPNYLIGIDLGLKDLVITSNGFKYQKLQELKKLETKLKGLNKWLSRSCKW